MVGTTYGTSWGQWGPIGAKKMGQNRKNYLALKFEFLITPQSSIWAKYRIYGYGTKSRWGPSKGPYWVQWGPIGAKKMGQHRKNWPGPKIRIFYYSARSSIWAKNRIDGYGAKSRWGPPRVHFGANGVPLGQKNGSKPSKITMPQNSDFDYSAVIDLGKKSNLWLSHQVTVGTP